MGRTVGGEGARGDPSSCRGLGDGVRRHRGQALARDEGRGFRGLFDATLAVNRSIGGDETRAAVLSAAGSLLRSPHVTLTAEPPESEDGTLAAPVELADRRLWLSVSGRSRTEPFDDADRALLDALASMGAIALANADLYAEVEQQKDNLSVITSSLGEGVCAIDNAGKITFMNPAGARMLGWPEGGAAEQSGAAPAATETPRFLLDPAMRVMALRQNVVSDDTRFERADGSHFPVTMTASPVVDDAGPSAAVIVFRDTSERKAFEEQLARHAFQDPLTGLANRRLLLDHLDHALLQATAYRQPGRACSSATSITSRSSTTTSVTGSATSCCGSSRIASGKPSDRATHCPASVGTSSSSSSKGCRPRTTPPRSPTACCGHSVSRSS